jgi:transcriptional regulator with XRE-family HTH domain
MHLPNRLATLRVAAKLTAAQLAAQIGVDETTIWRWERSKVGIPDKRKTELATLFGVTVGHLMCWTWEDNGNGDAEADVA